MLKIPDSYQGTEQLSQVEQLSFISGTSSLTYTSSEEIYQFLMSLDIGGKISEKDIVGIKVVNF